MSDSQPETQSFQAEVRQLLDIVIHSLYTDKEIFIRELISNASDSLEKFRLKQLTENSVYQGDLPLEINITTDEEAKTLTLIDHGIGMNRAELADNLGTIARSGSKEFLEALKEKGDGNADVIGQFGVGFYSAFMAADKVEVYTHSWDESAENLVWSSDGQTGYTIADADEQQRGCKIVVHLKDDSEEFSKEDTVKGIIERYSRFVSFPLNLNGELVNTQEALWLKSKSDITDEEYTEFYKYCANAYDEPRGTLHFSADAPIDINALLFTPAENQERFGMGQMKAGVSLYCRKVLIDAEPQGLLPEWLRFLRGVVDSADLPLNISRETMQDSALVQKLNRVLTKRYIKELAKQAKNDPEKFNEFFERFGRFLKEGIATSMDHQEPLAGLLRFESSMLEVGEKTSFDDYVNRTKDDQDTIYFLSGQDYETMMNGPYIEAFKKRGIEVALFTDSVDDYILETLREFKGKKLMSADRADIELGDLADNDEKLSEEESKDLVEWLGKALGEKVESVDLGKRLVSHPVVALQSQNAPSGQVRAMMEAMGQDAPEQKARLEFNPNHEIVAKLYALKDENEESATKVVNQLADNALLAAGLVKNPANVIAGMNDLIGSMLK